MGRISQRLCARIGGRPRAKQPPLHEPDTEPTSEIGADPSHHILQITCIGNDESRSSSGPGVDQTEARSLLEELAPVVHADQISASKR